ncbi:MAG: hypothetical protein B7X90_17705 [Novosphingobium sp. 17-62-19]|uniref:hypothetical protein n=1 Tax=Novosphingobium sp. 17-62-19 TaxID=1970406 RepID=UPI000BCE1A45|nr:hypothetical protein [Novosphingobium sp. 17-62-19]OYX94926.1 MAG: hypothetical protein B7Y74_05705 [Novosphingobium sp. 35-62-5]OZA16603.1 MAG: hypothetical protein B7X90_17705 [Novosphingobium sp. 17-62-19]HQS96982.1 hypothetical protein [Novosphingobium sp.]
MNEATLTIGAKAGRVIRSENELLEALSELNKLPSGECAALNVDEKFYIRAERHGEFWAVETQRGGYFTRASFTAEMTTEFSDRTVKTAREARSFLERIKTALSVVPERSLSTAQVITLFGEFLAGRRFSIPQSGA